MQFKFFREAPAWKKLQVAGDLARWAVDLSRLELERRYPEASPAEIRRRLADKILGPELAARVYGPLPTGADPDKADGHAADS